MASPILNKTAATLAPARRIWTTSGSETTSVLRIALLGALAVVGVVLFSTMPASAQDISVDFGDDATLTERALQIVGLITVLSLAPSILVMVTSFTRIVVVLSLLRTAIGLQTAPPNSVMVSLALFLTAFVMGPTLQQSYDQRHRPAAGRPDRNQEAFTLAAEPLHEFMAANMRDKDIELFY